jgi:hypothetical protein
MDGCCDDSGDLARILVRVPEDGGDEDLFWYQVLHLNIF